MADGAGGVRADGLLEGAIGFVVPEIEDQVDPWSNQACVSGFFELMGKWRLPIPVSFCGGGSFSGAMIPVSAGIG
jgi:hypothetical protein